MNKKTMIILISVFVVVMLFGCNKRQHTIYSEGYFEYIIVGENSSFPDRNNKEVVVIAGFTEVGIEQEVIEVPREIDGKPVIGLGYRDESFYHCYSQHVSSEKLKKIYIYDNIKNVAFFVAPNADVMICSLEGERIMEGGAFYKRAFIYKSLYETSAHGYNAYPANIVFSNNYLNEGVEQLYRLDNIDNGDKIPEPPIPVRKGFEFLGWYKEPECLNIWNFDIVLDIDENTEIKLYAKWQ